ncbi:MAG: tol-pal system protein YbgF [Gammaproteobacteria bacterium]|nr:tol-pal system protein YbgF [Gammaproteobacteria bacterium]
MKQQTTEKKRARSLLLTLTLFTLMAGNLAYGETVEQRLSRLERMQDSKMMIELLDRVDTLQREVRELRGTIEEGDHALNGIKKRQRELYLDIDQRLSRLERERSSTTTSETSTVTDAEPAAVTEGEQQAYQLAFGLLRKLRYEQAITAFEQLIKDYPDGSYAPNARYWIAEANYARREYKRAISDYQELISRYPNYSKVAEAMLKAGYCHYELKERASARAQLEVLKLKYPGTNEAAEAIELLKKIDGGG